MSFGSYENLRLEVDGAIATLTIQRPEVLNALNAETIEELGQAVEVLASSSEILVVLLTGAGPRAFVAGADIAAMTAMEAEAAGAFCRRGQAVFSALESLPMPVIAVVQGFALGGGCELAMACDFIVASEKARFGQPEVNLGLIPGFGGTQRLARLVGRAMAKRLIMTGEMIGAAQALSLGLVTEVVAPDELMSRARELAELIASKAPLAIAASKEAIRRGIDAPLEAGMAAEAEGFEAMFRTQDMREGTAAFLAKRNPEFEGR